MGKRKILVAGLLALQAATAHAQIYRCEQNGKFTFSDEPCQAGAKATQKDYGPPSGASGAVAFNIEVGHYTVHGSDYDSLAQSLRANGPKGFHGLATWKIGYGYTTKKQRDACLIDTVTIKVGGEILMPRWVDELAAPPELQQRWSTYYAALKRHEDGHVQHGRELALLVRERLMGLGALPCEQVPTLAQGEFQRLYRTLEARDREYDARTKHGETQGARF